MKKQLFTLIFFLVTLYGQVCRAFNDSPQIHLYNALIKNSVNEINSAVIAGADVNSSILPYKKRPLFIAASLGHYEAVKCLLNLGAQCDPEINLELEKIIQGVDVYVLLAAYGAKKFKHVCNILLEEGLIIHLDFEGISLIIKKFPSLVDEINKFPAIIEYLSKYLYLFIRQKARHSLLSSGGALGSEKLRLAGQSS